MRLGMEAHDWFISIERPSRMRGAPRRRGGDRRNIGAPPAAHRERTEEDAIVTNEATTSVLVEGLKFPEAPRWHDGRLWFSDFYSHRVLAADLSGKVETIVEVPGQPSGLGPLLHADLPVDGGLGERRVI